MAARSAGSRKASARLSSPGDRFFFSGLSLELERIKDTDLIVHASSKSARIVTYGGQRMSMSTHLAERVRHFLCETTNGTASPTMSANGSRSRAAARSCPSPTNCWSRPSLTKAAIISASTASKAGTRTSRWACCSTKRMEAAGLKPLGYVANDYALACYCA